MIDIQELIERARGYADGSFERRPGMASFADVMEDLADALEALTGENETHRAERDAALQALTESRARFGDIEQRIREKQAEAWFEGYGAAVAVLVQKHEEPNPYRNGGSDG